MQQENEGDCECENMAFLILEQEFAEQDIPRIPIGTLESFFQEAPLTGTRWSTSMSSARQLLGEVVNNELKAQLGPGTRLLPENELSSLHTPFPHSHFDPPASDTKWSNSNKIFNTETLGIQTILGTNFLAPWQAPQPALRPLKELYHGGYQAGRDFQRHLTDEEIDTILTVSGITYNR